MAYQRLVEQRGIWLIKWVKTGEPIFTNWVPTIHLLIAYSVKTNEQELYIAIAKPQNEARSDTQLPEEGRSAAISSYCYAS